MTSQMSGYGYYRWSSAEQTEGDSKARQLAGITRYAEQNNIRLLGIFGDEAVSAKDGANLDQEFAKLLKVLKQGECIICELLDRVSRADAIDTLHFLKHKVILAKDAHIFTFQDSQEYCKANFDHLGTKLTLFLSSELGHQENIRRTERIKDFFTRSIEKIKNGIPVSVGTKIPSWIKIENEKWGFNEDKKRIIKRIFKEYLDDVGMRTIAVRLNKENTPPLRAIKKKTVWSVSTISSLLHSENVLGTLHFRGEKIKNAFPEIVSEEDFLRVQVKLQHNRDRHGKVTKDYRVSNLFRGLIHCRHCGKRIMVEKCVGHRDRHERPYHYFACYGARQGKCTAKRRINADRIEKLFFVDCLGATPSDLLTSDNKEALTAVASIEEKMADIQRNIDKYLALMEKGFDFGKIEARLSELREQKRNLDTEMAEAKRQASSLSHMPQVMTDFATLLHGDLADDEIRQKIVNMMPFLVKEIRFDLSMDSGPDFEVTFVNGVKWSLSGSAQEIHFGIKNKKLFVMDSTEYEPVLGVWGDLLKIPS
jgi:DNA invertase Pin-like site-specific DNA recombinase